MKAGQRNLRRTLGYNTLFSVVSAVTLIVFNKQLSPYFYPDSEEVLSIVGICVLVFAIYVAFVAQRVPVPNSMTVSVAVQDFIWVFASIVVLLWPDLEIAKEGRIMIGVVAVIVGVFGLLQLKYRSNLTD